MTQINLLVDFFSGLCDKLPKKINNLVENIIHYHKYKILNEDENDGVKKYYLFM
jgi:hypothetical protein